MFERTAKEDGTNKAVNSKLLQTSKINRQRSVQSGRDGKICGKIRAEVYSLL